MNSTTILGDISGHFSAETDTEQRWDSALSQTAARKIKETIGSFDPTAPDRGYVLVTGTGSRYRALAHDAIARLVGDGPLLRITCSRFSQHIDLGALLFLLATEPLAEHATDAEVLDLLRQKLQDYGNERVPVLVENAGALDSRSSRLLTTLAQTGHLLLILFVDRRDGIDPAVDSMLSHGELRVVNMPLLNRSELERYLSECLQGPRTPEVGAHYWAMSRGDLDMLDTALRTDIRARHLIQQHGCWGLKSPVLCPQTTEPDLSALDDAEKSLFHRIVRQDGISLSELLQTSGDLEALDGLLLLDLVRRKGPGRIIPAGAAIKTSLAGEVERAVEQIAAACYEVAYDRLTDLQPQLATATAEVRLAADLARRSAAAGLTRWEEVTTHDAAEPKGLSNVQSSKWFEQALLFDWYAAIRQGHLPAVHVQAEATDALRAVLEATTWSDAAHRLMALLCVAYRWAHEGYEYKASKLLSFAVRDIERLADHRHDHRFRLLFSPMVFLAEATAVRTYDWAVAQRVDNLALRSLQADAAAESFVTYFACIRALRLGRLECAQQLAHMLAAQEAINRTEMIPQMARCLQLAAEPLETRLTPASIDALVQLARPTVLTVNSWSVAQLAAVILSYRRHPGHIQILEDLSQRAVAAGLGSCAAESFGVLLALGQDIGVKDFESLPANDESPLIRTLRDLAAAESTGNTVAGFALRSKLASGGQRYHVEFLLHAEAHPDVATRRRVHQVMGEQSERLRRFLPVAAGVDPSPPRTMASQKQWSKVLTPRELAIAELAASGLRNAQIAQSCSISVRTVEGHLYQIHTKLNIRNRRELRNLLLPVRAQEP
ncbi:helix-turn-helix transcriptional regulator [Glutamicibacter sp. PS]|uniref:helix-turn-helix transcriptional regulator n=1 Tax=Glutamicibacter sp. PS TaxID=3075634 RepID=UPI00284BA7C3|nr:helix-turn-helix transcriptional regulator [Glutamicibacter sp. PS]MDR4533028.1 helix-turn-helix transcriptional regulator [Glutamicibacter sp. PS]